MTDEADRRPYTYEDAARACEVSTETIRAKARRGKLKKGRPTNSGRPTVLLSQAEIDAIRGGRPFRPDGQPPGQPDGQPPGHSSIISQLEGRIAAQEAHIESLQAWLATAEQRALKAEERAEKAEQRLVDELARLAAQNHPPATDFTLPDAALEAIRADLESEKLPSKELHGPSDSGQRTRLAEAFDIIRMELDGPMSNEQVPSAASAKPGRLDGFAAIRSEVDGNDEEEGRGSDDQAAVASALPSDSKSESAPLPPGSRWWSRFLPRRRGRTT